MDIEGLLVTAGAMSCQKTMADTCIEQGEIEKHLESRKAKVYKRPSIDFFKTEENSRDRYEIRRCWVTLADNVVVSKIADWSGLKTTARIESERTHKGKTSFEQRYYICSKVLSAGAILHASRSHWGVESMHWMLDVRSFSASSNISGMTF